MEVMELPKSRINAGMLAQFIDRPVCFVGRLEKVCMLAALSPRSVVLSGGGEGGGSGKDHFTARGGHRMANRE